MMSTTNSSQLNFCNLHNEIEHLRKNLQWNHIFMDNFYRIYALYIQPIFILCFFMDINLPYMWLKYYLMNIFPFYLDFWAILKHCNLGICIILLLIFAIDLYKICTARPFHIQSKLLDHMLNLYKLNSKIHQTSFLTHHLPKHFSLIILFINHL